MREINAALRELKLQHIIIRRSSEAIALVVEVEVEVGAIILGGLFILMLVLTT